MRRFKLLDHIKALYSVDNGTEIFVTSLWRSLYGLGTIKQHGCYVYRYITRYDNIANFVTVINNFLIISDGLLLIMGTTYFLD